MKIMKYFNNNVTRYSDRSAAHILILTDFVINYGYHN